MISGDRIEVSRYHSIEGVNCVRYSLLCNFDEFAEDGDAFGEVLAQHQLRDHPVLHLVESAQEDVQVCCDFPEVVAPKRVVDELVLKTRLMAINYSPF